MDKKSQLIVALDMPTLSEAQALVYVLGDAVEIYKVGSQLFTACGPQVVENLVRLNKKVFLDLKFHDIPNTVASAVKSAVGLAGESGLLMMTVHTRGGEAMLKAAVQASVEKAEELKITKPMIVGVTVLTSDTGDYYTLDTVLKRAQLAKECGLEGVVASSQETAAIRKRFGRDLIIITPGIRPAGADAQDQKRITTPFDAIASGSDYLVVGRPIVAAQDPLKAAKNILQEIKEASKKA